jgi:hypothetical protein
MVARASVNRPAIRRICARRVTIPGSAPKSGGLIEQREGELSAPQFRRSAARAEVWHRISGIAASRANRPLERGLIVLGKPAMLGELHQGCRLIRIGLQRALQQRFRFRGVSERALLHCEQCKGLKVAGIELHELPERVARRLVIAAPAFERADLPPDLDAVGIALEDRFEHAPGLVEGLAITQIGGDLDLHAVVGRISGRRVVEMGAGAVMVTAAAQEPREVQANSHVVR